MNAQCVLKIQQDIGSFSDYIWSFVNYDYQSIQNNFTSTDNISAETDISKAMSKAFRRRGFKLVDPRFAMPLCKPQDL